MSVPGMGIPYGGILDRWRTATAYLNEALPAWIDFELAMSNGFELDESPLDYTTLICRTP